MDQRIPQPRTPDSAGDLTALAAWIDEQVPGQIENDMILGTSAYKNGFNAAVFRPKTDAGLGWLRGELEPQVVRTYYLDLAACTRSLTGRASCAGRLAR